MLLYVIHNSSSEVLLLQVTDGKQNYSLITGIQGYNTLNLGLRAEKHGRLETFG